jgi:hypothetical protein
MSEDILRKLERRIDRRTFLRGSGLAAAAFVGLGALPAAARAQDPARTEDQQEKDEAKPAEKPAGESEEKDPFKETKRDAEGREYRMCPQCGYNMYKQDRTWTCENCGYSYVE